MLIMRQAGHVQDCLHVENASGRTHARLSPWWECVRRRTCKAVWYSCDSWNPPAHQGNMMKKKNIPYSLWRHLTSSVAVSYKQAQTENVRQNAWQRRTIRFWILGRVGAPEMSLWWPLVSRNHKEQLTLFLLPSLRCRSALVTQFGRYCERVFNARRLALAFCTPARIAFRL